MLKKRVFFLLPLLFLSFFAESATVFGTITGLEVTPPTVSTSRGEEISKIRLLSGLPWGREWNRYE